MSRLNILIVHRLGDPAQYRAAVAERELCLPRYAPQHNYIVQCADLPLPGWVREIGFHGIILGPTFLCDRYNPELYARTRETYEFIGDSRAFKIALPQDDYDCCAILDRWLVDWRIDLVYTICPDHWEVLYPAYRERGQLHLGYTGYVSDELIARFQSPKPRKLRRIDVSYRANKLGPNFGRLGYMKGILGDLFRKALGDEPLVTDISTQPEDTIWGTKWYDFVEDSRFVLNSSGGSSLLDPEGDIRRAVQKYLAAHPEAEFDEVETACFPGQDGKWIFTMISPRNIEAALAESVQIATPDSYNGLLARDTHYVPFEPDGSNVREVLEVIRDEEEGARIAAACKESILSTPELRYANHVEGLIESIRGGAQRKGIAGSSQAEMDKLLARFRHQALMRETVVWTKRRWHQRARSVGQHLRALARRRLLLDG